MPSQVPVPSTYVACMPPSAEYEESKRIVDIPMQATEESSEQSELPDGDLTAWLQCANCFFLYLISWGLISSWGEFQRYYEIAFPTYSASDISWIGSIQAYLLFAVGAISGPVYDYGYLQSLVCVGCSLCVLAMVLLSVSTKYWHLILCQGILFGLGSGCLFIPCLTLIPSYFKKRRAFALGLSASGSPIGGILFPILFHQLQPRIGFGWTTHIIALIMFVCAILPLLGIRKRDPPVAARKIFDAKAWTEIPFLVFGVFCFLVFMGSYIPPFYIQSYGSQSLTGNLGHYLLPILNLGSLLGRIIPPYYADKLGPANVQLICVLMSVILAFIWIAVFSAPTLIVFSFLYGFFFAAVITLCPNIVVSVSPSLGVLGVRLGMYFLVISVGLLIGSPIAGAIGSHGWFPLKVFTGGLLIASFFILLFLRLYMHGSSFKVRC